MEVRNFEFEHTAHEDPTDRSLQLQAIADFFAAGAAIYRRQQQQALLDSKPDFNKPVKPNMPSPADIVTQALDRSKLH